MRQRFNTTCVTFMLLALSLTAQCSRVNVLFLMVDDLRLQHGSYSGSDFPFSVHPEIHTPHLDSLASRSILFQRAYVQQALCGPSRASILTGRRPDTTLVHSNKYYFRNVGGNFTTLPQYFKQNGYQTIGIGKIFQGISDKVSWTRRYIHVHDKHKSHEHSWKAFTDVELKTYPLKDRVIADHAINTLRELANTSKSDGRSFFVAAGFFKPHLPLLFPESYMTKYYPESAIRLPGNHYAPANMPEIAWTENRDIRKYEDIAALQNTGKINSTFPEKTVLDLRRAYYSTVTWIDSLIGEVIKELDDLGLSKNTVISFVSDHGYHLGENGLWGKNTNFERSTRVPMMISIPGVTDMGIQTEQLVETVDLFPTLAEAAGLKSIPVCPEHSSNIKLCTEGISLMPLTRNANFQIKSAVFSQIKHAPSAMGYSLRTKRYRYTEWISVKRKPIYTQDWNDLLGVELYDHDIDSEENNNRAKHIEYQNIRQDLSSQLRLGWRKALDVGLDQLDTGIGNAMGSAASMCSSCVWILSFNSVYFCMIVFLRRKEIIALVHFLYCFVLLVCFNLFCMLFYLAF